MKPGIRTSAIHPIVSDDPCSFSNRLVLFSSVSVFESDTYRCIHAFDNERHGGSTQKV